MRERRQELKQANAAQEEKTALEKQDYLTFSQVAKLMGGPIGKYADFQKALVEASRSLGCQMNVNKAVDCIRFFKEAGMVMNGVNGYFRNAPRENDSNKPF